MQRLLRRAAVVAALALGLAACGGGAPDVVGATATAATPQAAAAGLRAQALAVSAAAVEPAEAARQLMDFAEASYPTYFPGHEPTQSAAPFAFRHYASTGVYLGVVVAAGSPYVTNGVYVMGGSFGAAPQLVGVLTDFITPVETNPLYSFSLASDKAIVLQGGSATVQVQLTRAPGFDGAVQLTLTGLPAGVAAGVLSLPPQVNVGELVLTAQAGAPHSLPTAATVQASAGSATASQALSVTVRGAPGVVDTSFGGGITTTPVGIGEDYANAVAVQADGKVIVAGSAVTPTGTVVALVRYGHDGGLDTGFGTGGKVLTPIGTHSDAAAAVAVQPDGRIVVAGSTDQPGSGLDFAVLRYESDGRLDASFGQGGKVITAFGNDTDRAWAVAVQADGRIVVAGETQSGAGTSGVDFALARYLADGRLDASFGQGGKVVTALKASNGRDAAYALALPMVGGEQRILAVGGEGDFIAARYTAGGALDTGFASGGKIVGLFNASIGAARAVTLLPGGQAVLAGAINNDFAAVQLTPGGALDATFGQGGKRVHAVSATNWDGATAIVRQADGKLLLGGWAYSGNSSAGDFAALRLLADGTPDAGFGDQGVVIHPAAAGTKNDLAHALALQADERVPTVRAIQAGEANGSNHDFALLRLWL